MMIFHNYPSPDTLSPVQLVAFCDLTCMFLRRAFPGCDAEYTIDYGMPLVITVFHKYGTILPLVSHNISGNNGKGKIISYNYPLSSFSTLGKLFTEIVNQVLINYVAFTFEVRS